MDGEDDIQVLYPGSVLYVYPQNVEFQGEFP
jgi:hypothetical protein